MTRKLWTGRLSFLLACSWLLVGASSLVAQKKIDFAHDILPVLKKRCASCHSNGIYKGGFSMDTKSALLDSGAVELKDASSSELIARITSRDPDEQMPPDGKRLTANEVERFKKWIDEGVDWTPGFSFRKKTWKAPIKHRRPTIPKGDGNPVDAIVGAYFQKNKLEFPGKVDDRGFLRRVYMDLIGVLPTPAEQQEFLANTSASRRTELIQKLLARKRDYADHWMTFWNDLLRNDYAGTGFIDGGRKQITAWLHRSLYENKPYDQFVRELISPTQESDGFIRGIKWRGRVNASQVREVQFAQNVAQVFLGENLKCASCHDSFIDDWKLNDAYGMAAIVARRPLEMYRCDKPTGKKATPKFLWPELGKIDPGLSMRGRLKRTAELVTGDNNGRFARTIVNRIWQRMMGRGIVEPVDMMSNRPFDADLIDYLAIRLVDEKYDLKKIIALIATSRIYQSQVVPTSELNDARYLFKGPLARRLTAEQFIDAVWYLTGTGPNKMSAKLENYRSGKEIPVSGKWYWNRESNSDAKPGETVLFSFDVNLKKRPEDVSLVLTCDNQFAVLVGGKEIKKDQDWTTPELVKLTKHLKVGNNRIVIVAKNGGKETNPAGLYFSVFLNYKQLHPRLQYRSTDGIQDAKEIQPLAPWYLSYASIHRLESQAAGKMLEIPAVRASLMVSNPLMRSLGRPNREQVVTSRPAQLSTLQAIDLSNGQPLFAMIETAAERFAKEKPQRDHLIKQVFEKALCREPTRGELTVLQQIVGEKPEPQSIADLIWSIMMLPEFQHVR